MKFNKRVLIYGVAILFAISIYYDLIEPETKPSSVKVINESKYPTLEKTEFLKVKVQKNDSILSIVNRINKSPIKLPSEQVIKDFLFANPTKKSAKLKIDNYYYFPVYE